MAASGTRLILCRYLASTHHVFPTKIVYKQCGFHIYINNKLFFYDSLLQGMTEDKRFSKQQIQMEIWFINPLMFSLLTLKTIGTFWAKY
jgi:hypothetical protein